MYDTILTQEDYTALNQLEAAIDGQSLKNAFINLRREHSYLVSIYAETQPVKIVLDDPELRQAIINLSIYSHPQVVSSAQALSTQEEEFERAEPSPATFTENSNQNSTRNPGSRPVRCGGI